MAARKPKVKLYWSFIATGGSNLHRTGHYVVNWRLIGANGEIMCQSTQGSRDKTDAVRSLSDTMLALTGGTQALVGCPIVGPGKKPT